MRGDTTEAVQALAKNHGVSERTAWRWLAAMRAAGTSELLEQPGLCRGCHSELPQDATIRRRYCDDTCRQYSRRARLARLARAPGRPSSEPSRSN